jgi:hypothetical protein
MIKYAIIIMLVLVNLCCYANIDYVDYSKEIVNAERMFLGNNFSGSITQYRSIFNKYPKAYLKDVFIATEIACLAHDKDDAMYFLEIAFRKGLHIKAIMMTEVINKYLYRSDEQKNKIDKIYEIARAIYLSSIDFNYRNQILLLMRRDDYYKLIPNNWRTSTYRDSLDAKILNQNLADMICLIDNFGYPGESKIGIVDPSLDFYCDDAFYLRLCSFIDILFYHNICSFQLLMDKCNKALHEGDLDPKIYSLMYEWSYFGFKYYRNVSINKYINSCTCNLDSMKYNYNVYLDPKVYNPNIKFVDSCRANIGIASTKQEENKKEFEKQYNVKLFFGTFSKY